tara:strand:+ start:1454 stop:2398 length:945 start_codon:yes stop_codon:yes gene_type:complete
MLNKTTLTKIGLDKYVENGVLKTLKSSRKLCIDVGLSEVAPYSATWLLNDPDRCVIGIEPLEYNWERLDGKHDDGKEDPADGWAAIRLGTQEGESDKVKTWSGVNAGQELPIENRFFGLRCAIDDVREPVKKDFYHMSDPGNSSLLRPTKEHPGSIKKMERVQCVSLQHIFSHIDWKQFLIVEHLKVDCEGNDLQVIKSAGKWLKGVLFVTMEMSPNNIGHNVDEYSWGEAVRYMSENGFEMIRDDGGNVVWMNLRFADQTRYMNYHRHNGHAIIRPDSRLIVNFANPFVVNPDAGLTYWCDNIFEDNLVKIVP